MAESRLSGLVFASAAWLAASAMQPVADSAAHSAEPFFLHDKWIDINALVCCLQRNFQ